MTNTLDNQNTPELDKAIDQQKLKAKQALLDIVLGALPNKLNTGRHYSIYGDGYDQALKDVKQILTNLLGKAK